MQIQFEISMEPVAKGRPRFTRKGFVYTPGKTRSAESEVRRQAEFFKPLTPLAKQAYVRLLFIMPIPQSMMRTHGHLADKLIMHHTKKPDLDNLEKLVIDALNKMFWTDDSIIHTVEKSKRYGNNPRIQIFIQGE